MEELQQLEREIFSKEFNFSGSARATNFYFKLEYMETFLVPKILGEMLNERRIFRVLKNRHKGNRINRTELCLESRKKEFFESFYGMLEKVYDKKYLRKNPRKILNNYLDWGYGNAKTNRKEQALKLMSTKDFKIAKEMKTNTTKFDILSKIQNGRVFFSSDGRLSLEAYSESGLAKIFEKVNHELLKDVEIVHLGEKKYIKTETRYFKKVDEHIAIFTSDSSDIDLIAYGYFKNDVFGRQDSFVNEDVLFNYLGDYKDLPLVENYPTPNRIHGR